MQHQRLCPDFFRVLMRRLRLARAISFFLLAPFSVAPIYPAGSPEGLDPLDQRAQREPGVWLYMNFPINCHDWINHSKSAEVLARAARLFSKYGVKGDFYFTEELAHQYSLHHKDIIQLLLDLNMGIGMHHRPPHPLWNLPTEEQRSLNRMSWDKALERLKDFESRKLDMRTGRLKDGEIGGFQLLEKIFGRGPRFIGALAGGPFLSAVEAEVLYQMGARMYVTFHSQGDPEYPLMYYGNLMQRPCDVSIVRTGGLPSGQTAGPVARMRQGEGEGAFWWSLADHPDPDRVSPVVHFRERTSQLPKDRVHFANMIIHENNWYMSQTPWAPVYYSEEFGWTQKNQPKLPPWEIVQTPLERFKPQSQIDKLFEWYEEVIKICVETPGIRIVSMNDVLLRFQDDRVRTVEGKAIEEIAAVLAPKDRPLSYPPRFVRLKDTSYSLADSFQALSSALDHFRVHSTFPPQTQLTGILGPLEKPSPRPGPGVLRDNSGSGQGTPAKKASKQPGRVPPATSQPVSTPQPAEARLGQGGEIPMSHVLVAVNQIASRISASAEPSDSIVGVPSQIQVGSQLMNALEFLHLMAATTLKLQGNPHPSENIESWTIDLRGTRWVNNPMEWTYRPARMN